MKLLQTTLNNDYRETIRGWIDIVKQNGYSALFHIYVPYDLDNEQEKTDEIRSFLMAEAPKIPVVGCSTTGEIINGQIKERDIVVSIIVLEKASSSVEVLPFYTHSENMNPLSVLEYASNIPHLKGIEILTAASYQRLEYSSKVIDSLPEEVEIFGGVAVGDDKRPPYIFANNSSKSFEGSAFVFYSGEELHLQANRLFGWKPIGYPLKVTKSDGPMLYEIDNRPAYEVYNHYLHIRNNQNFFYDALEFPFEVREDEERAYIRHAKSVNPDGSILMSSNIPQGSNIRITFGDPRRIIKHTRQTTLLIREFAPDFVYIVNCMGRKLFWGDNDNIEVSLVSKELSTTGFSALGEIMRYKGSTFLNNLSIVTVAMREGPKHELGKVDLETIEQASNLPITARLAIFINTITEELMEKNKQLNEMLYKASHDALTGLLNRGAIEREIYETHEKAEADSTSWYLIMFDVDDFKKINDSYGHSEGDFILKMIAKVLSDYLHTISDASAGRWGGEEFMLVISGKSDEQIMGIADEILDRIKNAAKKEYPVTVSIGVTKYKRDENILKTLNRVDELMYKAKKLGKARVCSD